MPLAVFGAGVSAHGTFKLFIVEKSIPAKLYLMQALINRTFTEETSVQSLSKENFQKLLNLAESESERERLKYAVAKSSGLSNTKVKSIYGLDFTNERYKNL